MKLSYQYNDGGRSQYYRAKNVGDCVVRAFTIATGRDYKEVYDLIKSIAKETPRNGVSKRVCRKVAEMLGGEWTPTMKIGSGCHVHLRKEELPKGRIVCQTSKHLTAVINGTLNDIFDWTQYEDKCVYGYWTF